METPTGPRGNRVLVLLVLPFYLAWSALRGLANALVAAADRMAELIASALRALGDLLRPLATRLMVLARGIGRIMARIGRALAQLARVIVRALDATIGRVLRAVLDALGRFGVALAGAIVRVIRWIWDPRSPIRIAIVAIATAAVRMGIAVVRLGRAAGRLAAEVGRAIAALVGPPLAKALAAVRHLLGDLARAARTVVAAIGRLVRPVVRAFGFAGAVFARAVGRVRAALAPIGVALGAAVASVRHALAPLAVMFAAAIGDARRTLRQLAGLREVRPPDQPIRARIPAGGGYHIAHPESESAGPAHALTDRNVPSRRSAVVSIAATTTAILLPLVIGYDLLAFSDGIVAIALILGVGFLVGLVHYRARGRDALVGYGLGNAAVVALHAMLAPLLHLAISGPLIGTWLASTVIGLPTFYAGGLVGDVTAPPTEHSD